MSSGVNTSNKEEDESQKGRSSQNWTKQVAQRWSSNDQGSIDISLSLFRQYLLTSYNTVVNINSVFVHRSMVMLNDGDFVMGIFKRICGQIQNWIFFL